MILHGYCVRRAGEPPPEPGTRGIGGAEVFEVREGTLAAWASRLDAQPARETERLREHDAVVRAALRTATPLPLRFGSVFSDEAALRVTLAERGEALLAALERVAGRVEVGAAVGWDRDAARERILAARPELRPATEKPRTGRAYLEARRREHALEAALRGEAEALLDRVSRVVGEALPGTEEARTLLPAPGVAGTLAHLVLWRDLHSYREVVERASAGTPEVEVRLSGPWAPYSFV